jgi:uncharacterized membrane protein YbhN (UPF0104 family)
MPTQPRVTKNPLRLGRPRDWLIGTVLLIGLVIAVDRTVGWGELLAPWRTLSPLLLVLLLALSALSWLLRAVRAYDFFQERVRGRFLTVVRLSLLHNVANNLLPMRSGELVFPWLMRRYFGHGFLSAGASLVWIRLLDLHFLVLIGLLILWLRAPSWWWPVLALAWMVAIVLLLWLGDRAPSGRTGLIWRLLRFAADAAPSGRGLVARLYLWTAASWATKLFAYAMVMHHFVPVDFWRVLAGVVGAELSSVLPFHGVAGSGSYELAGIAVLVPLGVGLDQALAGAVNVHLFLLGVTLLMAAIALMLPIQRSDAAAHGDVSGRDS